MKQLTQTKDYLLLIDEEIVCKTGELYLTSIQNRIIPKSKGVIQAGDKIIAYRKLNENAKELDLPELPPFEVDIEELAFKELFPHWDSRDMIEYTELAMIKSYVEGYKAAQSKQFSLEDMKKALSEAFKASQEGYQITADEIIQSLSTQQFPKEFIPDYESIQTTKKKSYQYQNGKSNLNYEQKLKTIINSESKQELVGIYKY